MTSEVIDAVTFWECRDCKQIELKFFLGHLDDGTACCPNCPDGGPHLVEVSYSKVVITRRNKESTP